MVAKLVIVLFVLALVIVGLTGLAFWYFDRESQREFESEQRKMDQTDRIVEMAEDDDL